MTRRADGAVSNEVTDLDEDSRWLARAKQGVAVPLVELRITDEDGASCPGTAWRAGELSRSAPWLPPPISRMPAGSA